MPNDKGNSRRINFLYRVIRAMASLFFHLVYRIQVEGRENLPPAGPVVILPKHQFWNDNHIVALAVPQGLYYIAKQELFVFPPLKYLLSSLGGIPLDRQKPVKSMNSFRALEQFLGQGEFIVVFPEGTYCPHTIGRGKSGMIQCILRFQEKEGWVEKKPIPFIPVGIEYTRQRFRTRILVRIGKPLYGEGESQAREFTDRILSEIAQLSGISKTSAES